MSRIAKAMETLTCHGIDSVKAWLRHIMGLPVQQGLGFNRQMDVELLKDVGASRGQGNEDNGGIIFES